MEYQEEHLWLKNAINRILRRRLDEILAKGKIGSSLIEELIRGRYLENNYWPETKALAIEEILEKYRRVLELLETRGQYPEKTVASLESWFLGLASVELEQSFQKSPKDRIYINYFWQSIKERVVIDPQLSSEEIEPQLYLAVFRNFLKADAAMEHFEIFRLRYPLWFSEPRKVEEKLASNLLEIKTSLEQALKYPLRKNLDSLMKKRGLLILILQDLIDEEKENALAVLNDPEQLEEKIKKFYEKRYLAGREKLQTAAIRAIVFLILTKMVLLFITEIPFQLWLEGQLHYQVLAINTLLPPLLLIASSFAIKMPGEEQNFLKLVSDFVKITKTPDSSLIALDIIKAPKERSWPVELSLGVLYGLNFAFTGWLFWLVFKTFNFNVVDGFILVFFLSLVSFFAFRLRKTANELAAVEQKDHILMTVIELALLPTVELGRILSQGLSSINITAFIFDFLLETPFKSITSILEEWFSFVRERKARL